MERRFGVEGCREAVKALFAMDHVETCWTRHDVPVKHKKSPVSPGFYVATEYLYFIFLAAGAARAAATPFSLL